MPQAARAEITMHAERYLGFFERYVRMTDEIRTIRKEYLRSVQIIDPLLEKLYIGSLERVAAKRRAIERSTRLLSLPVIAVGGIVLVATALFSLTIALTVTRSVDQSKAFAERIASGDRAAGSCRWAGTSFSRWRPPSTRWPTRCARPTSPGRPPSTRCGSPRRSTGLSSRPAPTGSGRSTSRGGTRSRTDRVRDILGIEPEEVLQGATFELLHPEDAPRAREVFDASVASGTGWQGVMLRWRHKDGTYRWVESNAMAVADARGTLVGFRGTDRDITERRRLEQELVRTQKLEAIGTLAGGIAHDFNNLLQGLFGYISLARMNLGRGQGGGNARAGRKGPPLSVNLTNQLLTFAKGGQPLKRILAPAAILEDPVKFALSGSRSDYRLSSTRTCGR